SRLDRPSRRSSTPCFKADCVTVMKPVSPPGRTNDTLLNIALLVGVILVCCLLSELALRIAFSRSMDFSMEMWKYATQLKQPASDPQLSFSHTPNSCELLMRVACSISSHVTCYRV